jgi:tripartite-type tricarboxylate transporter receptor subunit TctC
MDGTWGNNINRRDLLLKGGAASLALAASSSALMAQTNFPSESIELVVHAGAGGGTDLTALALINAVREVEPNWRMALVRKTGGSGAIAHEYAMSRPKDGHTMLVFTGSQTSTIARGKSPMKVDDMVGIARATIDPGMLMVAGNSTVFKTTKDLLDEAKKRTLNIGFVTVGGGDHITIHLLKKLAGLQPIKAVPIPSGAEIAVNVIGGNLDAGFIQVNEAPVQVQTGELRPLLGFTAERNPVLPDVPTARELGFDVVRPTLRGFAVIKGTPDDVVAKLREVFARAMKTTQYKEYLSKGGMLESSPGTGVEFEQSIRGEYGQTVDALKELQLI